MLGNINKNLQNIPQTSEPSGNSPYFVQENCFSYKSSSFFIVAIGDFVFLRPLIESYKFFYWLLALNIVEHHVSFFGKRFMIYFKVLVILFCLGDSY